MAIYDQLNKMLRESLIGRDEITKNYIKSIKARLTEYCVANNMERNDTPTDDTMITVISAQKKSLEKAVKQLEKGGDRSLELVTEYKGEINFCNKFLPNEEDAKTDVEQLVDEAISVVGTNIGRVMGHIMKNNKSLDGSLVRSVVTKKLQG